MRTFFSFFSKTLGFFSAITLILFLIIIGFSTLKISSENKKFNYLKGDINSNNKIAIIRLNGPIFNQSPITNFNLFNNFGIIYVNAIEKILKDLESENVKAIIVSINSPGGSVSASYNLFSLFNNFKKNNDVRIYFHTNELLASGGYWVALSADKIFANYGALIGSIGVRGPDWIYYDDPILISNGIIGKTIQTQKKIKIYKNIAGKSKDIFDSFREPTNEELNSLQKIVNSIYSDFVLNVSKKRKIENDVVINDIGALIYDSKNAKEIFLIDEVINFNDSIKKIIEELEISDFQVIEQKNKKLSFIDQFTQINFIQNNKTYTNDNKICKLIKNRISVLFVQQFNLDNC